MKIGIEYIKYRRKARKRHGIHSPFVFNLSDMCLQIPVDDKDRKLLNSLIHKLKGDHSTIEIADYGAGSKQMGKSRRISEILKNSSSKGKYGRLLYQMCRYYKPRNILEMGTSLGIGSIQMALGSPESLITTIEACPNTKNKANENFDFAGIQPNVINDTFEHYLSSESPKEFDLIFVDGHHDGVALLRYMDLLRSFSHNETMFILDDIRWSDSMFKAWNDLIQDPEYHLSIDLFRMGILSKRPQQAKEHFTLRF